MKFLHLFSSIFTGVNVSEDSGISKTTKIVLVLHAVTLLSTTEFRVQLNLERKQLPGIISSFERSEAVTSCVYFKDNEGVSF